MNRLLFFYLIFLSSRLAYSQSKENRLIVPGSEKVDFGNPKTDIPTYIRLADKVKAEGINVWMEKVFKLNKDHKIKAFKSKTDELGFTHHKFQQYYKNYPVVGAVYIVHEKDNYIHSLNGIIQNRLALDETVSLSEEKALGKALNYIKGEKYIWEDKNEEEHLKSISKNPNATYYPKGSLVIVADRLGKGAYRLAYKFDIYSSRPLRRSYVYVDANNGAVININERIHHHGHTIKELCHSDGTKETKHTDINATGTAITKYSGTQTITTDNVGSNYRLRETGRGSGIQTLNMNRDIYYSSASDFTDSDNTWNTTTNYDNAAYDAHWGAEKTYDYYFYIHGRNSYDDQGAILYNYVHYDIDFDNAYWDGSRMTYGDGSNTLNGFTALTAIDVVGHELTHGVTEYSAQLNYADEAGALNESFSDMMGTSIEFYAKPGSANFLIGDQITYGGGALRNMANPNDYTQPDTYQGDMWDYNQEVHTNSGVGNFWYYLVCQGGTGTNDFSNNYSVTGIGITKAAKIAYRTLTTYLTPDATYADARFYSIQAAVDLYGPCTAEVHAVTNAWYAVGIGTAYVAGVSADFSASSITLCEIPGVVTFNNQSQNANVFMWTFGDGDTSYASNPSHSYSSNGTYTVKLTASGGSCGTNIKTKTNYIIVNTSAICPVKMPASGIGITQKKCTGKLYDNGGLANYSAYTDGEITIAPTGAAGVTLIFNSFNFEDNYDYLYIYDGPNSSSPLIGSYTGTNLPAGGIISSTNGSITLRQSSDELITGSGFDCDWSCSAPVSAPVAAFSANPNFTCDGIVSFTDESSNGPTSWLWTFGDGTTSTLQNPVKTYTSNGTFSVTLKSCNIGYGCSNIITKNSYVTVSLGSCITLPENGTGTTQTDCSGKVYDSGGSGNYQNGTNGTITIAPTLATKVILNFSAFSFEQGWDYLYIYDGPNTSSPLIGEYTGDNLPDSTGIIRSTGGSITLKQTSDGSIVKSGFVCDWYCEAPSTPPSAVFTANTTSSCNGIIQFTDQSTNAPTSWTWNFDDGTTSTSQNPTKTYLTGGTYNVSLTSCNSFGCNTVVKYSFINVKLTPCINMPATGIATTQTSCTGRLFDSGGLSNYQYDTDGIITIAPAGATKVNLTFSSFNFEQDYDFLMIFDGPSTSSPLIGTYTGNSLPGSGTINSTGGALTLKQLTDSNFEYSGFVCNWSCLYTTGINKGIIRENEIDLFPNPASHEVALLFSFEGSKDLNIFVYDLLGNVLYKETGTFTGRYQNKLDVSSFTDGVYFIIINDKEGNIKKKLTIGK